METTANYTQLSLDLLSPPAKVIDDLAGINQDSIIQMALNILTQRHSVGEVINEAQDTANYLRLKLSGYKNEVFCAIFLNNRHRIIAFEELFTGTINGASVYPRVVVQRVIQHNAAAVIFAHNHPSGISEPSSADTHITKQLVDALSLIDVRVLDHFIVGNGDTTSFAESGLL